MNSLNCLMYHTLYQIFIIILSILLRTQKHQKMTDNSSIRIYVNIIENTITFRLKTGDYLDLLTPETMILLGSTKSKITKDKNCEKLTRLEFTEVVSIIHCKIVNNVYQQDSIVLYAFVPNKSFDQLLYNSPRNFFNFKNL